MAPRKNNFNPDMRETRYKTETFANPYAPVAPKQTAFKTPKMSSTAMPNSGFDLGGFLKWGFGGPISQEQRVINQAKEDTSTVTLFGKTVQTSDLLGVAASAALGAAGIAAVRSGMKVRASTRSLASSRAINADAIQQNSVRARVQFREAVDARQSARRQRQSTTARAARLARVEAALKDTRPEVAERFGDRAYTMTRGRQIGSDMAASSTIGTGKRGGSGARSFPNIDSPLAGSHHSYTPLSRAWPSGEVYYPGRPSRGSNDATEWLTRTANAYDSYGRTGMERLSGMYSGRVPKGGWAVRPNLRKNTPFPTNYPEEFDAKIIRPGEMADGYYRDQVRELLDEASSFRNRSSWRLQTDPQNRAVFPRPYDWVTEPSWAPESYQVRVFRAAEEAASRRRTLPAPKKRVGRGK
jgi:hypothetical protein